jgi:hypothetical protein
MQARRPPRALVYLRRSEVRLEMGIRNRLKCAIAEAARHGVRIDAQVGDLDHMEHEKLTQYKDIVLER